MQPAEVLNFWFGDGRSDIEQKKAIWFRGGADLDREIRDRFGPAVVRAVDGGFLDWLDSARGRLALIILIDQFSRNIYRGEGRAFAADGLAQRYCLEGLERGDDLQLSFYERVFFYLPLEHAEDLALQERCVALCEKNLEAAKKIGAEDDGISFLDYARRHRDIILRFGRFPHRNSRLMRESTPEELEFLKMPGSSFG